MQEMEMETNNQSESQCQAASALEALMRGTASAVETVSASSALDSNRSHPNEITSEEAIHLLATSFLHTLILDVSKVPSNAIPGARHFEWTVVKEKENETVLENRKRIAGGEVNSIDHSIKNEERKRKSNGDAPLKSSSSEFTTDASKTNVKNQQNDTPITNHIHQQSLHESHTPLLPTNNETVTPPLSSNTPFYSTFSTSSSTNPTITAISGLPEEDGSNLDDGDELDDSDDEDEELEGGEEEDDDDFFQFTTSNHHRKDAGNGFAEPDTSTFLEFTLPPGWHESLFKKRREPLHILVLDEEGKGGVPQAVCEWLVTGSLNSLEDGSNRTQTPLYPCQSVSFIKGGLKDFLKKFPLMDGRIPLPVSREIVKSLLLPNSIMNGLNGNEWMNGKGTETLQVPPPTDLNEVTCSTDNSVCAETEMTDETTGDLLDSSLVMESSTASMENEEIDLEVSKAIEIYQHECNTFLGSLSGLRDLQSFKAHQDTLVKSVWFGMGEDKPSPIIPNFLYLSSCLVCTREKLLENGITHIIRLGWGFASLEMKEEDPQLEIFEFKIADSIGQDIREVLEHTGEILDDLWKIGGAKVLVHCHAGVSRSSTVVLAYLMNYHKMTLYDAWNLTYKARPICRPNAGFTQVLHSLERSLSLQRNPQEAHPPTTLPSFWMCESYLLYMDYVEVMYRIASVRGSQKVISIQQ